jgi:Flp pilus assembly protein TadG
MEKMTPVSSPEFMNSKSLTLPNTTIRDDIGQAFVELALVLPIYILLLVGAAEVGRLVYASIEVSNAARAGVAYGSQNHITASDTPNIQLAATKEASNITSLSTPVVSQSCACSNGTSITCANAGTTCTSPAHIIEYVQVQTSASVDTMFKFPGIPSSITLRGFANMRVEQ